MSATIFRLEYGTPYIKKRTERGWTADFVFNRESLPWVSGSTFYYWGISGETISSNYADNNLSFQFTEDGRICWKTIRYYPVSGLSGYTKNYEIFSGQTPTLCDDGTSEDFNITITFKRYKTLKECDLVNVGGLNDLVTGLTLDISSGSLDYTNWITGDTLNYFAIEKLNKKYYDERGSRLGTLKIYLNGNPIYTLENFEEIIPSERESQNILVQSWGGGTVGIQELHTGTTEFNLKNIQYYEEPLTLIDIRNRYKTDIKPNWSIRECNYPCGEGFVPTPTPTPTNTPTPSITPTNTPTPSITPTNTLTTTPTPTPTTTVTSSYGTGPFTFNFDYMLVEYFFNDGTDMDTMTYISNPAIMNNNFGSALPGDYVGTCAESNNGPQFPNDGVNNPYLIYGGDNTGVGTEAVLFNLLEYKNQRPSDTNIEITFTATWYGTPGINPVKMRATLWKGGTPVQDGYTFTNQSYTNMTMVESNGKVITSNTQACEAFEEVGVFQFDITNYQGQLI